MGALFVFGVIVFVSFIGGVWIGAEAYRRMVMKRFKKAVPIFQNVIAEVVQKVYMNEITEEEMVRYLKEEVDFLEIAMRDS